MCKSHLLWASNLSDQEKMVYLKKKERNNNNSNKKDSFFGVQSRFVLMGRQSLRQDFLMVERQDLKAQSKLDQEKI